MFRIQSIEPVIIAVPLTIPLKLAGVTIPTADNLVVRIRTTDGVIGWGEASSAPTMTGEFPEGMAVAARFLADRLADRTIAAVADIPEMLAALLYANASVACAVEMALLDCAGRTLGRPVFDLLGGRVRETAPSLTMIAGGSRAEETAHAARLADAGFTAFKVKVATSDDAETDLERAAAVRAAVGSAARVSADANQGYSRDSAERFARDAAAAGVDFFEQPLPARDLGGMAALAAISSVPLAADEGIHGIDDIRAHHAAKAAAGVSLKTIKLGGVQEVMAAGAVAQTLGLRINLAGKIAETSIASAAVAHLAVALPQLDWDVSVTNQYLADDVASTPLGLVRGRVAPPPGPGLGIMVDEGKIGRYRVSRL